MSLTNFFFLQKYFPGRPDNWVIFFYFWGGKQKNRNPRGFCFLEAEPYMFFQGWKWGENWRFIWGARRRTNDGGPCKRKAGPWQRQNGSGRFVLINKRPPFPCLRYQGPHELGLRKLTRKRRFSALYLYLSSILNYHDICKIEWSRPRWFSLQTC